MLNIINKLGGVEIVDIPMDKLLPSLLWAAVVMLGIALVFGVLIMWLGKVLAVPEDPRIAEVNAKLAGANCGGCGYPGCGGYAKALVEGAAEANKCGGADNAAIAAILGVEAGDSEKTYAIVHCNGGVDAKDKYTYQGYGDCASSNAIAGGKKICDGACLGFGTCVSACPTQAITMGDKGYAVVNRELCISCGKCISVCPKKIIHRIPESKKVWVACSSTCPMREVKARGCEKGCIKCGKCVKACGAEAITLQNNIPVIDYNKCAGCGACVEACPKKVIKIVE